jgi:hypothetical protein
MKIKFTLLLLYIVMFSVTAQESFYVKIEGNKSIVCGDSITLESSLVTPVNLYIDLFYGTEDIIEIQIENKSTNDTVKHLELDIAPIVDTVLYLKKGIYVFKWLNGCANCNNPEIEGKFSDWRVVDYYVECDFKVDSLVDPDSVSFTWTPIISDSNKIKIAPIETATYKVIASHLNGKTAVDSLEVIVNPLTASASDLIVSCGDSAYLNVITNYKGPDNLIYKWTPGVGLSNTTISNPVAILTFPAEYYIEVNTLNGCIATDTANIGISVADIDPSICIVTVNESNQNMLVWHTIHDSAIDSIFIYRESTSQTGQYDLIGKLLRSSQNVYIDSASNALIQSNKYRISAKDICGYETGKSSEHKTMHLNINKGQGNTWNLIWEEYEGFVVTSYKIYRGTSRTNLEQIGSTAGGNTSYTDFSAPEGDVYYQIEVISPQACTILKSTSISSSRSNIASNTSLSTNTDIENEQNLIYPNPANDKIKLLIGQKVEVLIYDLTGKFMYSKAVSPNEEISINNLKEGLYFIKIINGAQIICQKLLKY